jgi:hypothetical protein
MEIIADYCFERDVDGDFTSREVRVWAVFTRFDEAFATIARTDRDFDMFTVPWSALKNLRTRG